MIATSKSTLVPISAQDEAKIVKSFANIFKHRDIEKLSKIAYQFIYLASGFIAHTNIHGFRDEFNDVTSLARDIVRYQGMNQWDNFHPGERDYDYYKSKARVYNAIVPLAKAFLSGK